MDQAEQLRNVIKLHNQNNQNNARVVTITREKGEVGKSNICVVLCLGKTGNFYFLYAEFCSLGNVIASDFISVESGYS